MVPVTIFPALRGYWISKLSDCATATMFACATTGVAAFFTSALLMMRLDPVAVVVMISVLVQLAVALTSLIPEIAVAIFSRVVVASEENNVEVGVPFTVTSIVSPVTKSEPNVTDCRALDPTIFAMV